MHGLGVHGLDALEASDEHDCVFGNGKVLAQNVVDGVSENVDGDDAGYEVRVVDNDFSHVNVFNTDIMLSGFEHDHFVHRYMFIVEWRGGDMERVFGAKEDGVFFDVFDILVALV